MELKCTGCGLTRVVADSAIPKGALTARCPQCKVTFALPTLAITAPPEANSQASTPVTMGAEVAMGVTAPLTAPAPFDSPVAATGAAAPVTLTPGAHPGAQTVTAKPSFHGTTGSLFGIYIVNVLLSILSLSIYRFWGKVRIRNYVYSQTELMGERFAYHGTGNELFVGWIKAIFVLGIFYGGIVALSEFVDPMFVLLLYPFFLIVIPLAKVSVRRYRLSRTSWHGIRLSFRGSYKEGLRLFTKGTLLSIITVGLYKPFFHATMQEFYRKNSYYGDTHFSYDGEGWYLMKDYLLALFLTPFTLGLIWVWYHARLYRYDWERTSFAGLKFSSTATGWGFLGLYAGNIVIFVFTLGLGLPLVMTRILDFHYKNLDIKGTADLDKVRQEAQSAMSTGEGVTEFIELDSGLF